tara:strand:- start:12 stop:587 length:576 start_codon:yes stop_codon:yes gene_type:complete
MSNIPLYGQNKVGNILNNVVNNDGYKEITVVTAGDDSHTLSAADGGLVFISAALASGAVIKLPEATSANVGLEYRIVFGGTMAAAASIELPNAKDSVFAGVITQERCGNGAGVAEHATNVRMTTIVCSVSDGEKAIELDENDETFGGAIGTDLSFKYVAEDVVFVTGTSYVNVATTALDGLQSTTFTATGY